MTTIPQNQYTCISLSKYMFLAKKNVEDRDAYPITIFFANKKAFVDWAKENEDEITNYRYRMIEIIGNYYIQINDMHEDYVKLLVAED